MWSKKYRFNEHVYVVKLISKANNIEGLRSPADNNFGKQGKGADTASDEHVARSSALKAKIVTEYPKPEVLHFPMASHISILTTVNSAVDIQERLEMETVVWQAPFSKMLSLQGTTRKMPLALPEWRGG